MNLKTFSKNHSVEKIQEMNFEKLNHLAEIGKISCGLLHDIINPITGLILYLDMESKKKENHLADFVKPIEKTSQTIRKFIQIINEHLNRPNEIQIVDVEKIINNTLELFRPKAIKNNISFVFIKKFKKYLIIGNPLKIFQIFINLISNAVDAFEEIKDDRKKSITIKFKDEDGFKIIVRDNACGIDSSIRENIFELKSSKQNGLGQGLFHTKRIIEEDLESKIFCRSQKDKGTLFIINFNKNRIVGK